MAPSSVTSALLATLLSAGALGAVVPTTKVGSVDVAESGTFSVKQARSIKYQPSGPLALAKAYRKYGVSWGNDLSEAVSRIHTSRRTAMRNYRRDNASGIAGAVVANPVPLDSYYLSPVDIGTPAQTLMLDFDTGSSDLWVWSTMVPEEDHNGQARYDPETSESATKVTGGKWGITYGDGSSSSGVIYKDKVNVGGTIVESQGVEAADTVSDAFSEDEDNDGILGLGFSKINTASPKQNTWFDNVKPSLQKPLFTADLNYHEGGRYNFGYIDDAAHTGDITYTKVDSSKGFWSFTSSGYGVGSGKGSFKDAPVEGIADTATTLLLTDEQIVKEYYDQVESSQYDKVQGGYTFPCDTDLPSFILGVENARVEVPGQFINFAPTDNSNSTCFGGIQSNQGMTFTIWGDVLLKAAFVVFEDAAEGPRLGFAPKDLNVNA